MIPVCVLRFISNPYLSVQVFVRHFSPMSETDDSEGQGQQFQESCYMDNVVKLTRHTVELYTSRQFWFVPFRSSGALKRVGHNMVKITHQSVALQLVRRRK